MQQRGRQHEAGRIGEPQSHPPASRCHARGHGRSRTVRPAPLRRASASSHAVRPQVRAPLPTVRCRSPRREWDSPSRRARRRSPSRRRRSPARATARVGRVASHRGRPPPSPADGRARRADASSRAQSRRRHGQDARARRQGLQRESRPPRRGLRNSLVRLVQKHGPAAVRIRPPRAPEGKRLLQRELAQRIERQLGALAQRLRGKPHRGVDGAEPVVVAAPLDESRRRSARRTSVYRRGRIRPHPERSYRMPFARIASTRSADRSCCAGSPS